MVQSAERLRLPGALGRGDRYLRSYRDLAPRRHYRHRAGSVASRARCRRRQGTARGRGRTSRKRRLDSMTSRIIVAFVAAARSEEHTSELQSLMRISYAVFCLKKKKNYTHNNQQPQIHAHTQQLAQKKPN